MAYSAYAVANAFIQRAEEGRLNNLTPMKLQKLLYYTQLWHLKVLKHPILDDTFARWKFGPVIPAIYHEFKDYGAMPITSKATTLVRDSGGYASNIPMIPPGDRDAWNLVDAIIGRYGHLNGEILSQMTHQPGSAWAMGAADGSPITHEQIIADSTVG